MKITKLGKVTEQRIKALVYGRSGVGKTSLARTLPIDGLLIVDVEGGLLPISDLPIDMVKISSWGDLGELYQELLKEDMAKKYKTIFFDSLSETNELLKKEIVSSIRPSKKGTSLGKLYDELMAQDDWQLLSVKMQNMIRMFRDLPYNIVFTALEDEHKDERTGAITIVPSFNGRLALNIAAFFDEVFRMVAREEGGEIHRYLYTSATERFIAKDRSGMLDLIEEPDLTKIFKKIFAKGKKNKKGGK